MPSFAKVYSSIFTGSLRGKSDEILVFVNILTNTSKDGICDIHWQTIADQTGLSLSRVQNAIRVLSSPDPESRSPYCEGRRIVLLDDRRRWGWRVVNHEFYRNLSKDDKYREDAKNRMRQLRANQRATNDLLRNVASRCERSASGSVQGSGSVQEGYGEDGDIPFDQAYSMLQTTGIPDDFARMVHSYWTQRQGRDSTGQQTPWVRYVCGRWVREQNEWRAGTHREQCRGTNGAARPVPIHVQLRCVDDEISKHPANPESVTYDMNTKPTELQRESLRQLRKKRNELNAKIAAG